MWGTTSNRTREGAGASTHEAWPRDCPKTQLAQSIISCKNWCQLTLRQSTRGWMTCIKRRSRCWSRPTKTNLTTVFQTRPIKWTRLTYWDSMTSRGPTGARPYPSIFIPWAQAIWTKTITASNSTSIQIKSVTQWLSTLIVSIAISQIKIIWSKIVRPRTRWNRYKTRLSRAAARGIRGSVAKIQCRKR